MASKKHTEQEHGAELLVSILSFSNSSRNGAEKAVGSYVGGEEGSLSPFETRAFSFNFQLFPRILSGRRSKKVSDASIYRQNLLLNNCSFK